MKLYLNWVLLIIFLSGVLFCCSDVFVEKEVLPKGYIFIFFSILSGSISFLRNSQPVQFDRLTIFVFVFVAFILFPAATINPNITTVLSLIGILLLFIYFKNNHIPYRLLNVSIIGLCLLQAGYGLLQYSHLLYTSSGFPIVGSFDNPAGFAACLTVAFPLSFSLLTYSKYYRLFAVFSVIIMTIATVLSESRAGIISISIVSLIFIYSKYKNKLDRFRKYLILSFVIIGIAIFSFSLFLKKESVSGRILIWGVTWEMIKDAPVLGHGSDAFLAKYMDYQSGYFIGNPQSEYAILADNVLHPFNEYLLLIAEYGFIGFTLLLVVIFFLLRNESVSSPYMLCLISLGAFSLFSYPLKYPFVWVITAYCLAKISKNREPVCLFWLSGKKWMKLSVILCALIGMGILFSDIAFEYQWNKTAKASLSGKTREVLLQYEQLYKTWNHNHLFLYNYGAELNHIGEFEKSNIILHECEKYYNDYDVQMLLGDNYNKLKLWGEANNHYTKASRMCPNRFLPLKELIDINDSLGNKECADKIAKEILNKPVKVNSYTVGKIKNMAKERLRD